MWAEAISNGGKKGILAAATPLFSTPDCCLDISGDTLLRDNRRLTGRSLIVLFLADNVWKTADQPALFSQHQIVVFVCFRWCFCYSSKEMSMSSTEMGMLSMYPKFTLIVYFPIVHHHLHILIFEKRPTWAVFLIKFGAGQSTQLDDDPITIRFCIMPLQRYVLGIWYNWLGVTRRCLNNCRKQPSVDITNCPSAAARWRTV